MENALTIILAAILVVREWQNWKDRKDLLDRIMCANYQEFQLLKSSKKISPGRKVFPGRMSDEEMAAAAAETEKKE